jgi:hexosaminidase
MPAELHLIPQPAHLTQTEAQFHLTSKTVIVAAGDAAEAAQLLAGYLRPATGYMLPVLGTRPMDVPSIRLLLDEQVTLGEEGYRLSVTAEAVTLRAGALTGLQRGVQTVRQLLPTEVFSGVVVAGLDWTMPGVEIEDYPRFPWRGAMLDTGRHFWNAAQVKRFIDLLALHKASRFHWHLTEDQGWRIEIKRYPKLTEIGAWRPETMIGHWSDDPRRYDGTRYGGFYTQAEIKEVVAFAAARGITILPEIEMPGHSQAAIAAYPELGNVEAPLQPARDWGIIENVYNVEESTILFLQNVLLEVMDLFPSPYIHIGGDECPKAQWAASPRVQARMKALGIPDEHALQSYFIRRMDSFLTMHGRTLVGWDEILEGGLADNAVVMSWRGEAGGIEAARMGHDVVMVPTSHTYFDYYQADPAGEPLAIFGLTPLEQVYTYEPIPAEMTPEQARYVLGSQGQLWTEYIPAQDKLDYMAYPRLTALAEVLWSPRERDSYAGFLTRLRTHLRRLDGLGVNYRRLTP